jgi:aspartate/tyrosine/aromatic aminotransferase
MQALLWQASSEQQQRTACQESAQARSGAAALHTRAEVTATELATHVVWAYPTMWCGGRRLL